MNAAIGIDLGGTNLRGAIYAGDDFATPLAVHRERVGDARSPEQIAARLAALCERLVQEARIDGRVGVGLGLAAMLRGHAGVVANSPHLGWRDVDFGTLLREALGPDRPAVIYNDVDAVTYGEYKAGAAQGMDDTIAVYIGTGIGSGIIANGQLVRGATGCAAEIGHVKVVFGDDARPCACGSRGCIEAYAGGLPLQTRARTELAAGARSLALELAGRIDAVTPGDLDRAAAQGDDYALDLYEHIAPMLGAVLANAITLLNPACLLLGGGMLSRTPILREHVVTALEVAVNPPALVGLRIVEAALGDDAGLVGSALLAREHLEG